MASISNMMNSLQFYPKIYVNVILVEGHGEADLIIEYVTGKILDQYQTCIEVST